MLHLLEELEFAAGRDLGQVGATDYDDLVGLVELVEQLLGLSRIAGALEEVTVIAVGVRRDPQLTVRSSAGGDGIERDVHALCYLHRGPGLRQGDDIEGLELSPGELGRPLKVRRDVLFRQVMQAVAIHLHGLGPEGGRATQYQYH